MVMPKITQRIVIVLAIIVFASLSAFAQTSTWNIDSAHSTAQFTIRRLARVAP